MCLNCGCGLLSERHGDARNITAGDVREATKTAAHKEGTGGGLKAAATVIRHTAHTSRKRK